MSNRSSLIVIFIDKTQDKTIRELYDVIMVDCKHLIVTRWRKIATHNGLQFDYNANNRHIVLRFRYSLHNVTDETIEN